MRASLPILLGGLAGSVTAFAQTEVPGGTLSDETWTERGSPYRVTGAVTLDTLTLEAGARVLIASADQNLLIRTSTLTVNGEQDRPVRVEAETPTDTHSWYGLVAGDAAVTHLVVRHANVALMTKGRVTNSVFEDNVWGLELLGDTVVDRCHFANTGIGVYSAGGSAGGVRVENSLFIGQGLDGIACNGQACLVTNCTFDGNRYGLYVGGQAAVRNCIFTNNTFAMQSTGVGSEVSHSNFWKNGTDLDGIIADLEGNTALDPEYAGGADYHLEPTSPCIDAGGTLDAPDHDFDGTPRPIEGNGAPDDDGSSFDMGAYEFDPDRVQGSGGAGVGGGGGQAGEPGESTGGSESAESGGGSPGSGGATRASSGGSTTQAPGVSSVGGAAGNFGGSPQSSGGADSGSGGSSDDVDEKPDRLSKGCGCRLLGDTPRGRALGLVLLGAGFLRRRRRA